MYGLSVQAYRGLQDNVLRLRAGASVGQNRKPATTAQADIRKGTSNLKPTEPNRKV